MFWRPRYRYNVLKNVRIETSTGKVYRKYLMIRKGKPCRIIWKLVDYKTTHEIRGSEPRVCPADYVFTLLKTAF